MATVTATRKARSVPPEVPPYPIYRFTVDQYDRMVRTGILSEKDRVELLDGWIVPKMPHNPPHDATVTRAHRRLTRVLADEWLIRVQCAIRLKTSEPEPDLALVKGPDDIYFTRHPVPADIALLIEVADSTLDQDRTEKGPLYAQARISVYWIINLVESVIEVYTDPKAGRSPSYRQKKDYRVPDEIPLVIDGATVAAIPVRELLP